ncbi:DUF5994 family protein [Nocardia sp. N13]|uniref:DUF5994 family protein n=1 Tax=Nocardioides sp. N13(2025) TaxID=3453405 RepID=UPI003F76A4DF
MAEHPGKQILDGGWWPRTGDLAVELADLVDHFPAQSGRIARALVSPPDWDSTPRIVRVAGRYVKVGAFPGDDTHLILLTTSDRRTLHVLVVPPTFTPDQGDGALQASVKTGNGHTATEVLQKAAGHPGIDPAGHWSDDGGSWRAPAWGKPPSRRGE